MARLFTHPYIIMVGVEAANVNYFRTNQTSYIIFKKRDSQNDSSETTVSREHRIYFLSRYLLNFLLLLNSLGSSLTLFAL
jgi:hypothetical protein